MNNLGDQVYNLQMQELVTFWKIDFNPVITFDTATDGIIYISAYKNADKSNLIYDGNTYNFVGVKSGSFTSEINGQLPQPSISFDKQSLISLPKYQNIKSEYQAQTGLVYFDWRGATITRTRTTSNYLDDPSFGDSNKFYIDQITRTNSATIEARLTVSIGADKLNNESVQELMANRCALRYRRWNDGSFSYTNEGAGGCPYGNPTTASDWSAVPDFGNNYLDENDSTTTQENDQCSYSLLGCQKRFDPDENGLTLPFAGKYKAP